MTLVSNKNAWLCESEKNLLESPVMSIVEQRCKSSEDGRPYTFYLLRSRDWCNIIPVTEDGKIVMVRQHRIGVGHQTLEVPGGVCDATDADFEAAALRELEEETGYVALPGARVENLGWSHPNPAILNNRCHSFIVGPVRKRGAQNLDPGEMIEATEIPISELPQRLLDRDGQEPFTHALMLNAFLFLMLRDPAGSALLSHQLEAFARG
jgi:8-oxo-dGTP pyrophosphatase MutT (NUDIX family)